VKTSKMGLDSRSGPSLVAGLTFFLLVAATVVGGEKFVSL
jgi:hypothetical protein